MRHWSRPGAGVLCVLLACSLFACAKKEKPAAGGQEQKAPAAAGSSAPAGAAAALTPESAPYASVITGKGYQVVQARRFPAQLDSRRATVVVYRAPDRSRGGILYVRGYGDDAPRPVWHWFFKSGAPDSVEAVDVNEDGLWDVRVFMAGGTTTDLLQDVAFTFRGADRNGLAAMNGESSAPDGLWKLFDADTSTVWESPSAGAFVEIPNPFGLDAGQLIVRLAGRGRPKKLEIEIGGKQLQEVDLEATTQEQRFLLDPAVKGAESIRVSLVGSGQRLAVSELEIQ